METLRNEHTRVFMQDQALLKTIKDKPDGLRDMNAVMVSESQQNEIGNKFAGKRENS